MATHSSYLTKAFQVGGFKSIIKSAIKVLEPRTDEFDAIAFCGHSGGLVAPILAYELGKGMILVRKLKEQKSHSNYPVEGTDCAHYLIVDDFISSGNTIKFILDTIGESKVEGKAIGIYLWDTGHWPSVSKHGLNIWSPSG